MMHDPERDLLRPPCFYWPDLDSSSSAKLIKNKPDGVYIVRKSSHPEFRYTVTYKRAGRVASTRIQYNEESKLYSFNFASDYLPKKCTIRELLDAVAGQSIRMRREDSEVEVTFDMTLHAPVCRTLTLMEQCREKLLQLNPSQADIDGMERVLPKGLIQYLRERWPVMIYMGQWCSLPVIFFTERAERDFGILWKRDWQSDRTSYRVGTCNISVIKSNF